MPESPRAESHTKNRAIALLCPEQIAIASVLEQRREKTRALRQAMMQELLTGRTRLL
jgi:type I restriction enzyme S subunit